MAEQAAEAFAPGKHPVIAMTAGDNAGSYASGVADLQTIEFGEHDMMLALSVSGKTPWVWRDASCVVSGLNGCAHYGGCAK
ncbi:Glucokinase regulatory protein [Enterobacter hormaechei]|nr:Glucokinase regulatory protein [Enterobacter hormaechei]